MLPIGSLIGGVTSETSSTTSFVTPWSVKSPVILYFVSLTFSIFFAANAIVGNLATSRKASLRRCASRFSLAVSIEPASIVAATFAAVGCAASPSTLPLNFANLPRTLLTIM